MVKTVRRLLREDKSNFLVTRRRAVTRCQAMVALALHACTAESELCSGK
jgi:hypothetical protein